MKTTDPYHNTTRIFLRMKLKLDQESHKFDIFN